MADRSRPSDIDQLSDVINSLQKSLNCTICLELMTEPTKTRCGHSFCKSCIGNVLRKKNTSCPLCKKSLNRRNISKDDHLQTCIEKFKKLVHAINIDSHVDILSHTKQPRDTKESCSYPDARQSSRDSDKEKSSKKERSIRQLNLNANKQIDKPSTSHGTMTDRDNPQYDLDEKPETLSSLSRAFSGDENANATHSPPDIKIRTWIPSYTFLDKPNDDWTAGNKMPIEEKARPMNPISDDNGKSDETGEVYYDGIDAGRAPSQDKKWSTDCPERIDENNASQTNEGASQIGGVIKTNSTASAELKYNASHARIRAKESRERIAGSRSDIEEIVSQDNSATERDRIATSAPPSLSTTSTTITEQSTANWSRVIEFGKEMKCGRKRKIKKLDVSTERKKKPPRIIENIKFSPRSNRTLFEYTSTRIVTCDKSEKEANVFNRSESNERKQDEIDKSLDLSGTEVKSSRESQTESYNKDKNNSKSIYSATNSSYIMLEEGRKIHIMNLNNDEMNRIIGIENAAEDSHCSQSRREENAADYPDTLLTPERKRLNVLTPEKLNKSVRDNKIIHDVSRTFADNFSSSSCLSAENRTPGPRETNNARRTSSEAASPQSSSKGRLSLRRKPETDNNKSDSPLLSHFPLSYRLSIGKIDAGDRRSPVSMDDNLFNRLKIVRRDLNLKLIREDQSQTDQDTVSADTRLKNINEIEDNDGNVSGIVCQNGKQSNRKFTGESTMPRKSVIKSRNVENRSPIKFMQLGTLIRRRNIKYFHLGKTKHELSMPAEVPVIPVCNMQQSVSKSETISSNLWNDSQSSSNAGENIYFANSPNSDEAVSKEFPTASSTREATATSPLNRKKRATIVHSLNATQQSNKSIKNVVEECARSFHEMSCANKDTIHGISHTHRETSNSIKLLSPDEDSQLKFLQIDSPTSEREKLRRASSIKSAIKGNNFPEMESSRLAASSMPNKAREPFIERDKKKRMRCVNDRELFEDESSDGNDSVSSRATIKLDRNSKLFEKERSSRSDANKKHRLSSPDDQDIDVIPSVSKEQDAPEKKFRMSSSEPKSATHLTKNLNRRSDQYIQRNTSITDMGTTKYSTRQDLDEDIRNNEHDVAQKKLTGESKNPNSVKSMISPPEEDSAGHQSSRSSNNTLKTEKRKNAKSSQKSSAKESDMFESSSLFNSENLDYILQQQQSTNLNAEFGTAKKIVDSETNDDIINRVLQIDRSRSNPGACRPSDFTSRNDIINQREKDSGEYLLQDNFDEIIANVEQPQSEDFIPCTEQPDRNPNRPLAKQKTSNCSAMTDEPCGAGQETPIVPPSSTNDMFEYHSPRNVRRSSTTNTVSRNSDKENIACSQKRHGYVGDQGDRKDATANVNAIDKDSCQKIVSKNNVSREKEKSLEERNTSIQSAGRLHIDDDERATSAGNKSSSKDDTFGHDSLMNITQHQAQLQMFENELFGIAARSQTRTKIISQDDPFPTEQRTPRKRKQTTQDKNMESEERFADEDDVVENTPEKKMKKSARDTLSQYYSNGNNVKSRESTKIRFLTPRTPERIPSTSRQSQMVRPFSNAASTPASPFEMYPSAESTPITAHNSVIKINRSDTFGESKRTERIESGSILLGKQVDPKTLENVRRQPDKRDLHFVCSSLSAFQIAIVKEFAAKYNANYMDQFDRNVTHVIVKTTGEQNAAKSTLKYLQGIAHRKWIVSYRWIEDCIKQQKLLDELPYEATTQNDGPGINGPGPRNSRLREKGLFEGFTFLCVGPYDNVSLGQYQDLLLATGAAVVDSFEILAKMEGIKGIVIQDNIHDDKTIERWYRSTRAAPILVDWIVECIGQYKLFKLAPYILCLSAQDFCAIGYPRELVEEEEYSDDE